MIDLKEALAAQRRMDAASEHQRRYASLAAEAQSLGYKLVPLKEAESSDQAAKDAIKAQLRAMGLSPKGNPSLATLQAMLEDAQQGPDQDAA